MAASRSTTSRAASVLTTRLDTPLGPMVAGATDEGLCLLEFADRVVIDDQFRRLQAVLGRSLAPGEHPYLRRACEELERYFAGTLTDFAVPLVLRGTPFEERVWRQLLRIPFGHTRSYGELARRVGSPGAQRAVGRANGLNRISVIIPCHRVVNSDGKLGGYGGGLWRKQWLLEQERRVRPGKGTHA